MIFLPALLLGATLASQDSNERLLTNRTDALLPALTEDDPGFVFAVFGDRTGGPAEGIAVLRQAVAEVNLLDPDLVMTVGDLVNGYNETPEWMLQMAEYKTTMAALTCPWYPVAGNHDVYYRGESRPAEEHEGHYEKHFGPLWYAFEHKDCWFIVLYTDEPNPTTGERNFSKPECQRMSPQQFAWLEETLQKTRGAKHVFAFVHHPRWTGGNYGDDWERVHRLLADAGNVTAVFGGHIHHMRYDGPRDGIEYFTLATVGGSQSSLVPEAGWLHQYELVMVREDQISVVSYPVGAAQDPRLLTGDLVSAAGDLAGKLTPSIAGEVAWHHERGGSGEVVFTWTNPCPFEVDYLLAFSSADARWGLFPGEIEQRVAPLATAEFRLRATRGPGLDEGLRLPEFTVHASMLTEKARIGIPLQHGQVPFDPGVLPTPPLPAGESVLALDGKTACARIASEDLPLAPGAHLTLECWYYPGDLSGRRGLLTKTEGSEFGMFVSDGLPSFSVHLSGAYKEVRAQRPIASGRWHHLAGVWDGRELRLYVDGRLVDQKAAAGQRTPNALPLMLGADVDGEGRPVSFCTGRLDEVRLCTAAIYSGQEIDLERRLPLEQDGLLHLAMDGMVGPWLYDAGLAKARPTLLGTARLELTSE